MKIEFEPIGFVHSNFTTKDDAPRFHTVSDEIGVIEIKPEFADGLYRIEDRKQLVVLFYFDRAEGYELRQTTATGTGVRGVFSMCAPRRPNRIGMDIVDLVKVEGNKLYVKGIDMFDGTPVLDIKPFKPLS